MHALVASEQIHERGDYRLCAPPAFRGLRYKLLDRGQQLIRGHGSGDSGEWSVALAVAFPHRNEGPQCLAGLGLGSERFKPPKNAAEHVDYRAHRHIAAHPLDPEIGLVVKRLLAGNECEPLEEKRATAQNESAQAAGAWQQ